MDSSVEQASQLARQRRTQTMTYTQTATGENLPPIQIHKVAVNEKNDDLIATLVKKGYARICGIGIGQLHFNGLGCLQRTTQGF